MQACSAACRADVGGPLLSATGRSCRIPATVTVFNVRDGRTATVRSRTTSNRSTRFRYNQSARAARRVTAARHAPYSHERAMFALFERLLKPTRLPENPEPPPGLL